MTGVAGAPSVPLPLPLSGDTEGSEGDSGENDDDENSNDDDMINTTMMMMMRIATMMMMIMIIVMMRKIATEKEITSLEMTHFLINKLIRMSSYFCKSGCLQSMNLVI